jgi:hypothetical protein
MIIGGPRGSLEMPTPNTGITVTHYYMQYSAAKVIAGAFAAAARC